MIRKIQQWFEDRLFRKRVRDDGLEAARDRRVFDDLPVPDEIEIEQEQVDKVATDAADELDDAIEAYESGDQAQSVHNLRMARWLLLYQAARIEAQQQDLQSQLSYSELNEWNIRHQAEVNDD